jgi:hypothetical protein
LIHTETAVFSGRFSDQFQTEVQRKWVRTIWLGKSDKLKEERKDAG